MSTPNHCLRPSSSLPPVRALCDNPEETISAALHNLQAVYCPLRLPAALPKSKATVPILTDSGYVSEDEDEMTHDEGAADTEEALAALRSDEFERSFAVRWLTTLISRAYELPFGAEETCERIVDEAAFILASFSDTSHDDEDEALTRDFSFPTPGPKTIDIRLNDAPLSGTDHTDVGLQSWGASIILSNLICSLPKRFGLDQMPADASIIELGAGTGLVSLTLGKLSHQGCNATPRIIATDYHPVVLENLRINVASNFLSQGTDSPMPIETALLDWAKPPASLAASAHTIFAADVVYAPEHAAWLRDCAAHLLAPDGVFWLMVTVRKVGKFAGIPDTAEAAFVDEQCPINEAGKVFKIIEKQMLEKKKGIGRGDETGYMLFKIAWM